MSPNPRSSIADVVADPHFQARGSFESVSVNGEQRIVPAVHPKLSRTPGSTEWAGPELGAHTQPVLEQWLEATPESIQNWTDSGVISKP